VLLNEQQNTLLFNYCVPDQCLVNLVSKLQTLDFSLSSLSAVSKSSLRLSLSSSNSFLCFSFRKTTKRRALKNYSAFTSHSYTTSYNYITNPPSHRISMYSVSNCGVQDKYHEFYSIFMKHG